MSIPFVHCPECDIKLVSKVGFIPGQKVTCVKCNTTFSVPAPARKPVVRKEDEEEAPRPVKKRKSAFEEDEEEAEERPRKKKKTGAKASSGGYANSPLRFVILGVLVVTMLVLGYFLYRKLTAPPLPDIIIPAKPLPGED